MLFVSFDICKWKFFDFGKSNTKYAIHYLVLDTTQLCILFYEYNKEIIFYNKKMIRVKIQGRSLFSFVTRMAIAVKITSWNATNEESNNVSLTQIISYWLYIAGYWGTGCILDESVLEKDNTDKNTFIFKQFQIIGTDKKIALRLIFW